MPDITESIDQLTASLQQLTVERAEGVRGEPQQTPDSLPARELAFWSGVESFVQQNRDYAAATRSVSVGTY